MSHKKIDELIKKYADGTASDAETEELMDWYRQTGYQDAEFPGEEEATYRSMLQYLNNSTKPKSKGSGFRTWTIAASLTMFLAVSAAVYFFKYRAAQNNISVVQNSRVLPGGNKAVLTLANGKKISLTDASNGHLANQSGIQIAKTANGQLVYTIANDGEASTAQENAYNTIETPAGGQYQVILPDRSKVWLNARSSIKFPVSFNNAKERLVELTGEGYFEVEHDEQHPFRVMARGTTTEDLGTAFNIKAYDDDASIKTTLLKGVVKIMTGEDGIMLKPGEQATCNSGIKVSKVNIENVIAWKNGYFRFDDDNLEDVMKMISRWYNVRYVFEDPTLKSETYGAVTSRLTDITSLLHLIEETGNANLKLEGTNIVITRKKPD